MRNQERNAGEGRLPAMAPLANAYVPFQMDNPPKYEAAKGLIRGTLFPGLDLPFMGMVNTKEKNKTLLQQIQSISFAMNELGLYLDTHRDDMEALEMYQKYQKLYHEGRETYERMCGPLNHMSKTEGTYRWLDDPWPWEYAKNREV